MTNYDVATVGFSERERRVLRSMFSISKTRTPSFSSYIFDESKPADIVILDADNLRAINGWNAYLRAQADARDIPVVAVARHVPDELSGYFLPRPVIASRLLALLERVSLDELNAAPTLAIAVDDSQDASAPETMVSAAMPLAMLDPLHASAATTWDAAHGSASESSTRVLVVDDSLPVRVQMKLALKGLVDTVDFAESGEAANALLDINSYDVVFLDVILPGADGFEICRKIKALERSKNTPVIMLTSNSSPADRMKGRLAGCDDYLVKPVKPGVFERTVRVYLSAENAA